MKRTIKIISWLVAGSLALNIYTLSALNKMENNLTVRMERSVYNHTDILRSLVVDLHHNINSIKEASKLITSVEFKPNNNSSSPKSIHLDVEWTYRELEQGAIIVLQYREKGAAAWQKVEANQISETSFYAPLLLDPTKEYEYLLVSKGNMIRTEGISTIPSSYYQPAPIELFGSNSSSANGKLLHYTAIFSQRKPLFFDFFIVNQITAIVTTNGKDIAMPLARSTHTHYADYQAEEWELSFDAELLKSDITNVTLKIEYANGTTQEKSFTAELIDILNGIRY